MKMKHALVLGTLIGSFFTLAAKGTTVASDFDDNAAGLIFGQQEWKLLKVVPGGYTIVDDAGKSGLSGNKALTAGFICKADEAHLKLRGKTITLYPALLRNLDKTDPSAEIWRYGPLLAEMLGVLLERWGMFPCISAEEFPTGIVKENLIEAVKTPNAFPDKPIKTDYALILLFEGRMVEKKGLVRAQAVMTDAQGKVVWSQPPGEFISAGNMWPIALYQQIGEQLLSASDLEKPDTKPEPGPFETRARKRHENSTKERN